MLEPDGTADRPPVTRIPQLEVAVERDVAAIPAPGRVVGKSGEAVGTGDEALRGVWSDLPGRPSAGADLEAHSYGCLCRSWKAVTCAPSARYNCTNVKGEMVDDNMIKILTPLFVGGSVAFAIAEFGYRWDRRISSGNRDRVRDRMKQFVNQGNLADLFLGPFDRFFDPRGTGRPRILRAALASCLVLGFFLFIGALCWVGDDNNAFARITDSSAFPGWSGILAAMAFAIGTNLVGDIFSLWETRFILGRMAVAPPRLQALFVLLDLVATVFIYCIGLVLGAYIALVFELFQGYTTLERILNPSFVYGWIEFTMSETYSKLIVDKGLLFLGPRGSYDLISVYFYTALSTSIWAWLFFLGIKLWPSLSWVGKLLDVDRAPVGVAMTIGGLFSGLAITLATYAWMFRSLFI